MFVGIVRMAREVSRSGGEVRLLRTCPTPLRCIYIPTVTGAMLSTQMTYLISWVCISSSWTRMKRYWPKSTLSIS